MLSALAVAGETGLSRDKLIGLLWPESDAERARHSLTQALYAARRALRCDDLFLGAADVRLNPARITSDLAEFEAAVAAGEMERAATLYRGAFLDGFFLSGVPEFEQWQTAQRARIEVEAARVFEQLATLAERTGDFARATEWWQRLAAFRPLDSRIATRLMTSMASAGDRAGALRHARIHEALLQSEAGLPLDPSVAALVETLRAAANGAAAVRPAPQPAEVRPAVEPPGTMYSEPVIAAPAPGARNRSRLRIAVAAAAVLVFASLVIWGWRVREPGAVAAAGASVRVAVLPFRVSGSSPELRYLREGAVDLLSSRLSDDSLGRAIDPGTILGAWRSSELPAHADVPRAEMLRLAAGLGGVDQAVLGTIVGSRTRLIVSASVVRTADGVSLADAVAEGPADSIARVMDRLAARLLLARAGEDPQGIGRLTESLPALRAYLVGQASFQKRGYRSAMSSFDRALRLDSTFARAALRLAWVADRISETDAMHRGIALAWSARANLGERDAALLRAFAGPRYPAPSTADELLLAWHRPVDAAPRVASGWIALGARTLRDGAAADPDGANDRARVALERALALDPRNSSLAELLVLLAQRQPALPQPDSAVRALAFSDTTSPFAPFLRWRDAVMRGDSATLRQLRGSFGRMRVSTLRLIAMASLYDDLAPSDGERAVAVLLERASDDVARIDALEALHGLLLSQGRYREALEVTTRLRSAQPGIHAHLRLRVLDALYAGGDSAAGRAAADELERLIAEGLGRSTVTTISRHADLCVVAQWRLNTGDTTGVRATIRTLERQHLTTQRPRIAAAPVACAELLDAALAVVTRSPDAATRLARVSELAFTPVTTGDAAVYAPLLLAQLHERLGDKAGALRALRRRSYMSVWPRYHAIMRREEARLANEGA